MNKVFKPGSPIWCLVLACCFMVFNECGAEEKRHIPLEGQPNFRDLGGYKTTNGKTVKRGEVFRSGELPRLTHADLKQLEKLHLKTVVNFLTEKETKARGFDRLPAGVKEISLPIAGELGKDQIELLLDARKTGDFSKIPASFNPEIHRILIRNAQKQYAQFLREVADPTKRPIVFHCSHGVHRTGTAAAILLSALGVPWETVRKDYLLSNRYRKHEIEKRLAQLRALAAKNQNVSENEIDTTNMRAFYILEAAYIDASLDEIVNRYGSIKKYLTNGLGISKEEIRNLQNQLLE